MERIGFEQWKPREVARLLALVESERRYYQEIVATLPAALVVLASDRSIVSANRAFRRLVNLRSEDLRQKTIEQIFPSGPLVDRIRGAHVHGDTQPIFLNVEQRLFRITVIPTRSWEDEMEAETLLMVEDLTGLQASTGSEAAQHLEAAEPPAPMLDLSSLPVTLWQADAATFVFTFVGGAAEEILGYAPSHWLTTPQFMFERVHPDDRGEVMALYQAVAATGGEASAEFRAIGSSGEIVRCRETIRVSVTSAGQPGSIMAGTMSEIGQRAQLETQSLIAGRIDALRGLAGRLAHDFNNPLMIVTGYAEEMINALPPSDPLRSDIQEILTATSRMTELAGQLLGFTRSLAKAPTKVPLGETLTGLRERLQDVAGKGVEVELGHMADASTWADREQLEEAMLALAVSALENSREVSRLKVKCHTGLMGERIEPTTLKPGAYARIKIHAIGEGLGTPAAGVFESFLPSKDPAKTAGPAVSRAYANLRHWGGDVFFSSLPGNGSTFIVYLPYVEPDPAPLPEVQTEQAAPAPAPEPAVQEEPQRETILLVEDEPGIRALVRKILRRERYQVLEAGNGEEALMAASAYGRPIDLLLTDMMLPRMSGRDLAESLLRAYANLKVVYISGYTDDESVRSGEFPPGSKFLQKPFTLIGLTSKVREALEG
jgi:two-component system cell cycle sensor histidine kinase/response regulator CckA